MDNQFYRQIQIQDVVYTVHCPTSQNSHDLPWLHVMSMVQRGQKGSHVMSMVQRGQNKRHVVDSAMVYLCKAFMSVTKTTYCTDCFTL